MLLQDLFPVFDECCIDVLDEDGAYMCSYNGRDSIPVSFNGLEVISAVPFDGSISVKVNTRARYVFQLSGARKHVAIHAFYTHAEMYGWNGEQFAAEYDNFINSYVWDIAELVKLIANETDDLSMYRYALEFEQWANC